MTQEVVRDTEWLSDRIEEGLEAFFQLYSSELAELGASVILTQIMQQAYCEHAEAGREEGVLSVKMALPGPEDCPEAYFVTGSDLLRKLSRE